MYTELSEGKQNGCDVTPKPFKWRIALGGGNRMMGVIASWQGTCHVHKPLIRGKTNPCQPAISEEPIG